jgi:prepilin-type N-terminal cleavage/methylation domain-containing protein
MSSLPAKIRGGFTLVELMVAIAILAIIVVAVAQIVGTASKLTTVTTKHIDANSQARTVFDRMANDFARMVKRNDVDYIFFKANGAGGAGLNDTMFFFSEGASYFDNATFPTKLTGYSTTTPEKNRVSLVGYRINNGTETGTPGPTYYQLERLGKALSWDGYPSLNPVVFLTYPPEGTDIQAVPDNDNPPNGSYSTAFFNSTLYGGYSSGGGGAPSLVGTLANNFNDGADDAATPVNPYRPLGPQVFRFEFSFQLKDGSLSPIPVMQQANTQTPAIPNGVPFSNLTATQRPLPTDDVSKDNGTGPYVVGSRWYDTTDQIGYICLDPTPNAAIWTEIGIRDVAAIVITVAIIDRQGQVFVSNSGNATTIMPKLAGAFADIIDSTSAANVVTTWTSAITPVSAGTASAVSTASGIPQTMVSQIRIYQRYFYINNL